MEHAGILYLSKHPSVANKAQDGTFQLTLQAEDRSTPAQPQAWTLVVSGQLAIEFFATNLTKLTPGQPVRIWTEHICAHASPALCIYAKVSSIWLAPRAQQAAALLAEVDQAHQNLLLAAQAIDHSFDTTLFNISDVDALKKAVNVSKEVLSK